jgi:hypothetical protein
MNPENFLNGEEAVPLQHGLNRLVTKFQDPDQRRNLFIAAGIHEGFLSGIKLTDAPLFLAINLAGKFREYPVSLRHPDYHPLLSLAVFLGQLGRDPAGLTDDDLRLFERLERRARQNLLALKARSAVGRIETPLGQGIGTGVYAGNGYLLTCRHVFRKAQAQQAWVRFGYKQASYGLEDVFELELNPLAVAGPQDFALARLAGVPDALPVRFNRAAISSGQETQIRMIHHPLGQPVVISEPGRVVEAGLDYLDHDIPTQPGSSGAPLFDLNWQVVALHRGDPGIGRPVAPNTTEAVPLPAFWDRISPYLKGE